MADKREARNIAEPEPGFFKLSLAKGAPPVAARIFLPCPVDPFTGFPLDRSRFLMGEINGRPTDPWRIWVANSFRITEAEFNFLMADRAWAAKYQPDSPEANPYRAVTSKPKTEKPKAPTQNIRDVDADLFRP